MGVESFTCSWAWVPHTRKKKLSYLGMDSRVPAGDA